MYTMYSNALFILSKQGPTLSIVNISWQTFTEDTPQAQGIFVPIFGEYCLSKPLS